MPQKSIEQYERELMEMYRLALAKDPSYAALARQHSAATARDDIPADTEIGVDIPAPGVEEAVPLPKGIVPLPYEQAAPPADLPTGPAEPPAVAVVLPVQERTAPGMSMRTAAETPADGEAETVTEFDITSDPGDDVVPELDLLIEAETAPDPSAGIADDADTPTPARQPMTQSRTAAPAAPQETRRMTGGPNIGAGNLIVNVTTQNRTRPVEGALVTVSDPDESNGKTVASARTDSSGKTEPIRLPAPIREIPVYPQPMIGGDLSATYRVRIEAPGFETVSDEEASVFDGVTSVKWVDLTVVPADGRAAAQGE